MLSKCHLLNVVIANDMPTFNKYIFFNRKKKNKSLNVSHLSDW